MNFIDVIKAVILGIVEGITEWLPISSTGHMIIVNDFMKISEESFFNSQIFLYVVQLGAVLSIATLYFKKLNPFLKSKSVIDKKNTWNMWFKIIIACIPSAVIGLLFNDYMDKISTPPVVSAMLILYGVAFILVEKMTKKNFVNDINDITYKMALFVGLFQVLSIVPGTSRSGATILGAILLGASRSIGAEFSFFLSIPVMVGVSILKIGSNILEPTYIMGLNEWVLLIISMVVAYIVSLISVKFLVNYVKNHSFKSFGIYRIILGLVVLSYFYLV